MSRLTVLLLRVPLLLVALTVPMAVAQGPIDCSKDSQSMKTTKADFFWRGCQKLTASHQELEDSLAAAKRVDLAEEVELAARMMGCPLQKPTTVALLLHSC